MSFAAYFGMLAALAVVLLLLGLAMAALRRFTDRAAGSASGLPLQVVQRVPLGPKQGIAVVRIGDRVVAVSLGEGGVRPLLELDEADRAAVLGAAGSAPPLLSAFEGVRWRAALGWVGGSGRGSSGGARLGAASRENGAAAVSAGSGAPERHDFRAVLRDVARSATVAALLALPAAVLLAAPEAAAQMPEPGAWATPAPPAAVDVARVDTMITRIAPQIDLRVGDSDSGGLRLSGTVGVVVMMGLLTLLPTLLLMMTSFTRILVVLHFLRQALGTQSAPPAHLMAALALLLTGFVMAPTLGEVNRTALQPWMAGEIEQGQMMEVGALPFREFMLSQTRERDLATFVEMRDEHLPETVDELPLVVVMSAFVTSELRTAFQIGFALFLPFIVIDIVVAAVLMSMGMFMLPPAMISLPFKLLLFVLVDGWSLIVQGLVASFH